MKTKLMTTAAILTFALAGTAQAGGLGDLLSNPLAKAAAQIGAQKLGEELAGEQEFGVNGAVSPEELASAPAITGSEIQVPLQKASGDLDILAKRPALAIAGYNVGAFMDASISGSTTRMQGAAVSLDMELAGVDDALLARVAAAGYADLVARLNAVGVQVVEAHELFAAPEAEEITRLSEAQTKTLMDGRGKKHLRLAGMPNVGVIKPFSQVMGFGGYNVGDQASHALDAVVVYPNLILDFAWTAGGGQKMFSRKASVDGGVRFSVDQFSQIAALYSKGGRYADGMVTLNLKADHGVDTPFATASLAKTTDNTAAVAVSNALGVGMTSRKGSVYTVAADPARFEALALQAAKGFNSAFIQQVMAARGITAPVAAEVSAEMSDEGATAAAEAAE